MKIIWQHYCNSAKEVRYTWLEECPLCNKKIGFPPIQPELIDELHKKINDSQRQT